MEIAVRGRDLVTGLPREMMVTDADVREAIGGSVVTAFPFGDMAKYYHASESYAWSKRWPAGIVVVCHR